MYKRSMFIVLITLIVVFVYSMEGQGLAKFKPESDALQIALKRQRTDSGAVASETLDVTCQRKAHRGDETIRRRSILCFCGEMITSKWKDRLQDKLIDHYNDKHDGSWKNDFEEPTVLIEELVEEISSEELWSEQDATLADANFYEPPLSDAKPPESDALQIALKRQRTNSRAVVSETLTKHSKKVDTACRKKIPKGDESVKKWSLPCGCGETFSARWPTKLRRNLLEHCKSEHGESWEEYYKKANVVLTDLEGEEYHIQCICSFPLVAQYDNALMRSLILHCKRVHKYPQSWEDYFKETIAPTEYSKETWWGVLCDYCGEKFVSRDQDSLKKSVQQHCTSKHAKRYKNNFEKAIEKIIFSTTENLITKQT